MDIQQVTIMTKKKVYSAGTMQQTMIYERQQHEPNIPDRLKRCNQTDENLKSVSGRHSFDLSIFALFTCRCQMKSSTFLHTTEN